MSYRDQCGDEQASRDDLKVVQSDGMAVCGACSLLREQRSGCGICGFEILADDIADLQYCISRCATHVAQHYWAVLDT